MPKISKWNKVSPESKECVPFDFEYIIFIGNCTKWYHNLIGKQQYICDFNTYKLLDSPTSLYIQMASDYYSCRYDIDIILENLQMRFSRSRKKIF